MEPVTFACLGIIFGGTALKWFEMTLNKGRTKQEVENTKRVEAAKAKELAEAYHCPVVFQRQFEDKLIEAGMLEPEEKTVCEESKCYECHPTRVLIRRMDRMLESPTARNMSKHEHYENIQEWKRLNRPGGYKFI